MDIGAGHARAVLGQCRAESSPPPEPAPVQEIAPLAKFTPAGVLSALTMPPRSFTGEPYQRTGGERRPHEVGLRNVDAG